MTAMHEEMEALHKNRTLIWLKNYSREKKNGSLFWL